MGRTLPENDMNNPIEAEPMIDNKQAAAALRLPYYWFADHQMRARYRIPHYLMGRLVRFRLSELSAWASQCSATHGKNLTGSSAKDEK